MTTITTSQACHSTSTMQWRRTRSATTTPTTPSAMATSFAGSTEFSFLTGGCRSFATRPIGNTASARRSPTTGTPASTFRDRPAHSRAIKRTVEPRVANSYDVKRTRFVLRSPCSIALISRVAPIHWDSPLSFDVASITVAPEVDP